MAAAIAYFVLTNVIWIFVGLFALVFTVTKGGPGYATTPFDLMIYRKAFEAGELGYASALSVILFCIVLVIAARIDGAGYFEVLFRIALLLSVPGLVTVMIFNITAWWNDLLLPLVLIGDQDKTTLTVAVASIGSRFSMDFPLVLTGLFLASVPPVLAYIVLQRFIRRGLVAGAIK